MLVSTPRCRRKLIPLLISPGSHRGGMRPLSADRPLIDRASGNDFSFKALPCRRGDAVIFHSLAIHATPLPSDGQSRVSVDARYQAVGDFICPVELVPFDHAPPRDLAEVPHGIDYPGILAAASRCRPPVAR